MRLRAVGVVLVAGMALVACGDAADLEDGRQVPLSVVAAPTTIPIEFGCASPGGVAPDGWTATCAAEAGDVMVVAISQRYETDFCWGAEPPCWDTRHRLIGIDGESGDRRWERTIPEQPRSMAGTDGAVAVLICPLMSCDIHLVSPSNGETRWTASEFYAPDGESADGIGIGQGVVTVGYGEGSATFDIATGALVQRRG